MKGIAANKIFCFEKISYFDIEFYFVRSRAEEYMYATSFVCCLLEMPIQL